MVVKEGDCKSELLVKCKHLLWIPPYLAWPIKSHPRKVDQNVLRLAEHLRLDCCRKQMGKTRYLSL